MIRRFLFLCKIVVSVDILEEERGIFQVMRFCNFVFLTSGF